MNIMDLLTSLNDFMWSYFLIGLVIVTGIYFTFSTKFVQFTYIKEMFKLISDQPSKPLLFLLHHVLEQVL